MSLEEDRTFTITWSVKNFSMCPVSLNKFIESPIIQVRQFCNSEWSLRLYPKGYKNLKGFVSCFLVCHDAGINKNVKVQYTLCDITGRSSAKVICKERDFKQNDVCGYDKWIPLEDILKEKEYLPKDTFTIKCVIECKYVPEKSIEDEVVEFLLRTSETGKKSLYFNKCFCETIIPVMTKTFIRTIGSFLSISENERITLPLFSAMKETPSFYATLIKKSPIHIELKRVDNYANALFVKCTVSAVNPPKGLKYSSEDEFLLKSEDDILFKSEDDVWNLSPFLEVSKLQEDGYFKLNDGILYLQFDFAFSIKGQMHHIEKQEWDPFFPPSKIQCPLEIFTSSSVDDESLVVTLCTGDKTYTVHKALLKAKSEVFHAMFENDMMEKETGLVDIPDVDAQTLGRMLSFLYSGTVGDLSVNDVGDLYAAADKYQVLSLMNHCSSTLMRSMTESNVCEILILADLYQNEQLLKCAEDFVVANTFPDRLFMSQAWKNLMENHASVAAKVMYKLLMK